jgi:hypothetical protein
MTAQLHPGTDRRWRWIAGLLCVAVLATSWWWPRLSGRDEQLSVLVVGDGQMQQSRDAVERQLRGLGLSVEWYEAPDSWCAAAQVLPALIADRRPQRVVASFVNNGSCADGVEAVVQAAGETSLVVQIQPGQQPDTTVQQLIELRSQGVISVDPSPLLPALGNDAPCLWWDDCGPNGLVMIRDSEGKVMAAGAQRVARALAAVLT